MKKVTKILLPIASTVVAIAPTICMVSCSNVDATCEVDSETADGGIFHAFLTFKRKVTNPKPYSFYILEGEDNIKIMSFSWGKNWTEIDCRCRVTKAGVQSGDKLDFTLVLKYQKDEHSKAQEKQFPLSITYKS